MRFLFQKRVNYNFVTRELCLNRKNLTWWQMCPSWAEHQGLTHFQGYIFIQKTLRKFWPLNQIIDLFWIEDLNLPYFSLQISMMINMTVSNCINWEVSKDLFIKIRTRSIVTLLVFLYEFLWISLYKLPRLSEISEKKWST